MQIDLRVLEEALAPVEAVGQGESVFDVGGTSITVRMLLPSEEQEVQRYAQEAIKSADEGDPVAMGEFLHRFKMATLSYSIVAIGDTDLRDVDGVETGEFLEDGTTPIKVTKVKALREKLAQWSDPLITRAFQKFSELMTQIELRAEESIQLEPTHLDTEIERLQKRIEALEEQKKSKEDANKTQFAEQVGLVQGKAPQKPAEAPESPKEDPSQLAPRGVQVEPVAPATPREPIIPQSATPPPTAQDKAQEDHHQQDNPGFIDPDNRESAEAAIMAENTRLLEMRRAAQMGQPVPPSGSVLQAAGQPPGVAPHQEAARAEDMTNAVQRGAEVQEAQFVGKAPGSGMDVFKMPVEEVNVAHPKLAPQQRPTLQGNRNPRFRRGK